MDLQMGSHTFYDVQVPLLWGTRAIVQDDHGRLSIIDLSGDRASLEILGDEPAPGVDYRPHDFGIAILREGEEEYAYDKEGVSLRDLRDDLPSCTIQQDRIAIGTNVFSRVTISGFGVGIAVGKESISMGGPLPEGLARLVV